MHVIPNDALELRHLPGGEASWEEIGAFALTFNGYDRWPGEPSCGDVALRVRRQYERTGMLPFELDVLRTALFMEQRGWYHCGEPSGEEDIVFARALVAAIREKLSRSAP